VNRGLVGDMKHLGGVTGLCCRERGLSRCSGTLHESIVYVGKKTAQFPPNELRTYYSGVLVLGAWFVSLSRDPAVVVPLGAVARDIVLSQCCRE
jgi:hypothetical protein